MSLEPSTRNTNEAIESGKAVSKIVRQFCSEPNHSLTILRNKGSIVSFFANRAGFLDLSACCLNKMLYSRKSEEVRFMPSLRGRDKLLTRLLGDEINLPCFATGANARDQSGKLSVFSWTD